METMNKHGISVPNGFVAKTPDEAAHAFTKLGGGNDKDVVIKAQVLSGGRGLGTFKNGFKGGVHMVTKEAEARDFAESMLGEELVTKQNAGGIICNKVYLMERVYMRRELYLSILMDRGSGGPLLVASPFGGTSIEDVAASNPDAIFQLPIPITAREIPAETSAQMAENLGFEKGAKGRDKVRESWRERSGWSEATAKVIRCHLVVARLQQKRADAILLSLSRTLNYNTDSSPPRFAHAPYSPLRSSPTPDGNPHEQPLQDVP